MIPQVQSFSAIHTNHLDMGGLESFDDAASCDRLLESMQALRPLLSSGNNDILRSLQGMANCGSSYSTPLSAVTNPSPTTLSTEDLEILDSPSMLNSLEHDLLLSNLGTAASSMGISCDELSPRMDHSERWNFHDANYSMWKLQDFAAAEHSNFLSHGLDSALEGTQSVSVDAETVRLKWSQEPEKQADTRMDTGISNVIPNAEQKGVSPLDSPVRHGFSRENSFSDLYKQFDSSDNSDGMDDLDEGAKHSPNGKGPMSKNLISERRRRKKLNERLYSLRAIVPKISKMDKASIVGDAINYVRDLQKQVEDMQTDITNLQSNKDVSDRAMDGSIDVKPSLGASGLISPEVQEHKILELEVSKMEEQTYHLRIHCKKGPGVLVQLTRALEALDFEIVNANLTSVSDHILNTIVVKVKNGEALRTEELKKMTLDVVPKFGLRL